MLLDLAKFFSRSKAPKDVAKDRLKLVLFQERSNISPKILEMLRVDIIKVIQKYMDIDEETLELQMTKTQTDEGEKFVPALVANIPIKNVRDRKNGDKDKNVEKQYR